jgi:hypothetical protein
MLMVTTVPAATLDPGAGVCAEMVGSVLIVVVVDDGGEVVVDGGGGVAMHEYLSAAV